MAFPTKNKETVAVAFGGVPAQAVAVIPNSSRYRAFTFLITAFDVGKVFAVQGSFDGVNYFTLDDTSFVLPTPHFTAAAAPLIFQVELRAPLPGGLRIISVLADLVVDGSVQAMMYNSPYNLG